MDVLDHSCSKLGFGGKMCIDGTFKFEEETEEGNQWPMVNGQWSVPLKSMFPEIKSVNINLIEKNIPVLIVAVEKNRLNHIRELHKAICDLPEVENSKFILYVEHSVDANDLTVALWRFCNNVDPKRDNILVQRPSSLFPGKKFACLGLDGTRKTALHDNFPRDWPNIIVADDDTIASVDAKWKNLGLGNFIPSPSLKYKEQMYGEEAVVN
jgi:4-hydroxy-3-polyprenylbenzoate decarboxylase